MTDGSHQISLRLPATRDDLLIARMALSGLGMLAGLDVDLIGDLRMAVNECFDCLTHRARTARSLLLEAEVRDRRLCIRFSAEDGDEVGSGDSLDMDIARGVLETLMPQVELLTDEHGVRCVRCSMPV